MIRLAWIVTSFSRANAPGQRQAFGDRPSAAHLFNCTLGSCSNLFGSAALAHLQHDTEAFRTRSRPAAWAFGQSVRSRKFPP